MASFSVAPASRRRSWSIWSWHEQMLDNDLDALTNPDPDAPDETIDVAAGDLAYPSDLEVQPLSGTKYCYDEATKCAGEMMTTARGANYARPPPPPPPPVDIAAETAAASVVEDDSDPDDPTEQDAAATSEESTSIDMGDDSDPDAPDEADSMQVPMSAVLGRRFRT